MHFAGLGDTKPSFLEQEPNENRTLLCSAVKKIHLPGMLTYGQMTVNKQGCLGREVLARPVSLLLFI